MGTCLTSSECLKKAGEASGSCASGFGVCCVFMSIDGSDVSQNCSYIQNPGFPNNYVGSGISYTVGKCDSSVCSIRLDFEYFWIMGSADERTCQDMFFVTTSSLPTNSIPVICGINTGYHIYVDVGDMAENVATLNFAFSNQASQGTRQWDMKVTQIPCGSNAAPPNGCLQYLTGYTGKIKTFNFDTRTGTHLPNQRYSVCIRQERNMCCVRYQVCEVTPGARGNAIPYSLNIVATTDAMVDNKCSTDFIVIPGSSNRCQPGGGFGGLVNRYCGSVFNSRNNEKAHAIVCDCTPPFRVDVVTDALPDPSAALISRGFCLDYMQIAC